MSEQIKRLEQLNAQATPYWAVDPTGDCGGHFVGTDTDAIAVFEPVGDDAIDDNDEQYNPQAEINAAAAAEARNALPAFLALYRAVVAVKEGTAELEQADGTKPLWYMADTKLVEAVDSALMALGWGDDDLW